jgi:hypothetical protein
MKIGCQACDQTIAQACLTPPALCGLCRLMGPEDLARYFAKWNRAPAQVGELERDRQEEAA